MGFYFRGCPSESDWPTSSPWEKILEWVAMARNAQGEDGVRRMLDCIEHLAAERLSLEDDDEA